MNLHETMLIIKRKIFILLLLVFCTNIYAENNKIYYVINNYIEVTKKWSKNKAESLNEVNVLINKVTKEIHDGSTDPKHYWLRSRLYSKQLSFMRRTDPVIKNISRKEFIASKFKSNIEHKINEDGKKAIHFNEKLTTKDQLSIQYLLNMLPGTTDIYIKEYVVKKELSSLTKDDYMGEHPSPDGYEIAKAKYEAKRFGYIVDEYIDSMQFDEAYRMINEIELMSEYGAIVSKEKLRKLNQAKLGDKN